MTNSQLDAVNKPKNNPWVVVQKTVNVMILLKYSIESVMSSIPTLVEYNLQQVWQPRFVIVMIMDAMMEIQMISRLLAVVMA